MTRKPKPKRRTKSGGSRVLPVRLQPEQLAALRAERDRIREREPAADPTLSGVLRALAFERLKQRDEQAAA